MGLCVCQSVLDVNDETPTFNPRVYNVSLKESIPRDHVVARLACSDNDTGLNAELSYFITGQRSPSELVLSVWNYNVCPSTHVNKHIVWPKIWLRCAHANAHLNQMRTDFLFACVFAGGNQDGKFSVGFRDGIVRTVVGLDRETQAAYTLIVEAIGVSWGCTFIFLTCRLFVSSSIHRLWIYLL